MYWLTIGVLGMLAFRVPFIGFALGIGALLYFVYAIPYWLLFVVFFHQRPYSRMVFGMTRRTFAIRLAIGAAVVCVGSLLLGWMVLACLGAAVLYYCGETELKDRMLSEARAYVDHPSG
ncbi:MULTISPECIES: hypothetical protein [Massilia]|uniref:Transmembrane protein n=1 Tax=Massilia aurea TaxID=373040 RepID=A0A422QMA6_9BURK|nr:MULTISPECIES: hypothetical protein [Massilia]MDY0960792.1 hypothetical protein [Massilia sp. CFBP9026]RNF31125.1 hypothetical protein NM04_08770 [Massilia aurea]